MGSITFQIEEEVEHGQDPSGKPYIVIPQNGIATLLGISPAETVDELGRTIHGAMLSPLRTSEGTPPQGYDERLENWNSNLSLTFPQELVVGDVIIKVISRTASNPSRNGSLDEIASLHVIDKALTEGAFLGSSVGWQERKNIAVYNTDFEGWYNSFSPFDATEIDLPEFNDLMESLGKFYPLFAQNYAASTTGGYEYVSPYRFGGGSSSNANYGRYIAHMMGGASLALVSDKYSKDQIKQIWTKLVQHGIEWGDPMIFGPAGASNGNDGGHFWFHQSAIAIALNATGRHHQIPLLMANAPGNWKQAFLITEGIKKSGLSPHNETNLPAPWRIRVLGPQEEGNTLRIPIDPKGDFYQTHIGKGMVARRIPDGTEIVVAQDTPLAGSFADVPLASNNVFTEGDQIYFDVPEQWADIGQYDWAVKGYGRTYSPVAANQYRRFNNEWMAQIMALKAMRIFDPSMDAALGIMLRAIEPQEPASGNDYYRPFSSWTATNGRRYDYDADFYTKYWPTLSGLPQTEQGAPETPLVTLYSALPPGATADSTEDGVVIGLLPDASEAPVAFKGSITAKGTVEIRVLRSNDDSVVQDWTEVAHPTEAGIWTGTINLPKADGWWYAQARSQSTPDTIHTVTTKFAVGYKILLLGQSQMSILFGTNGTPSPYQMRAENYETASCYQWQEWNYRGGGSVPENLALITRQTASDGICAFVDQFRVFDPTTPLMIIRESVNGTSILQFTDDDNTNRKWSDLTNKLDKLGNDITVVVPNWVTSNASPLEGNEGIDILQGIDKHLSQHSYTPDHSLPEVIRPGYIYVTTPGTRHNTTATDTYREEEIDRANALGYPIGPPISDYEIANGDTAHPNSRGQGNVRLGARLAVSAARGIGIDNSKNPSFASAFRSVDGTKLYLTFNLPNKGALYSPAPNALSGLYVSEDSDASYSNNSFSTNIDGNIVELLKTDGFWASASRIRIRRLANLAWSREIATDEEVSLVSGELYESWPQDILELGLPIHGMYIDEKWTIQKYLTIKNIEQLQIGQSIKSPTSPSDLEAAK